MAERNDRPSSNDGTPQPQPTEQLSAQSSIDSYSITKPQIFSERKDYFVDWVLKFLGVFAAILFGVWGPMSYTATINGNSGNDKSQDAISSILSDTRARATLAAASQMTAMSSLATAISDQASLQSSALEALQSRVDYQGVLGVWEFCDGRGSRLSACAALTSSVDIASVVSSLGSLTSSSSATSTSSASVPDTRTPSASTTQGAFPSSGVSPSGDQNSASPINKMALIITMSLLVPILLATAVVYITWKQRRTATVDLRVAQNSKG